MWHFIHRKLVDLYRRQLAETKDEGQRARLAKVVAQEEARLRREGDKKDPEAPYLR